MVFGNAISFFHGTKWFVLIILIFSRALRSSQSTKKSSAVFSGLTYVGFLDPFTKAWTL